MLRILINAFIIINASSGFYIINRDILELRNAKNSYKHDYNYKHFIWFIKKNNQELVNKKILKRNDEFCLKLRRNSEFV